MRHGGSATAQVTTLVRASLSGSNGVVRDAYAQGFLGLPWRGVNVLLRAGFSRIPIVRDLMYHVASQTCFFDELVTRAARSGHRQIVVLAAGYDSRALRLADPELRFFEVDHPDTQADKRARLAHLGLAVGVTFVAVDFERDDLAARLVEEGFDPRQPALFLFENVAEHLAERHLRATLQAVRRMAAPGSLLALNAVVRTMVRRRDRIVMRIVTRVASLLGEPFNCRLDPAELRQLLEDERWAVARILDGPTLCHQYLPGQPPIGFWDHYVAAAGPC